MCKSVRKIWNFVGVTRRAGQEAFQFLFREMFFAGACGDHGGYQAAGIAIRLQTFRAGDLHQPPFDVGCEDVGCEFDVEHRCSTSLLWMVAPGVSLGGAC